MIYEGTTHQDLLMLRWWEDLLESGEMSDVMSCDVSPSQFFDHFDPGKMTLVLATDDEGIWFAQWFAAWESVVTASVWVRKDMRKTKRMATTMEQVLTQAFEAWHTIVAVTVQPLVAKMCERMGATNLGIVGKIFGGKDAWLLTCTRDAFAGTVSKERKVAV